MHLTISLHFLNVVIVTSLLCRIFDPNNFTLGHAAMFNSECEGDECISGTKISLGSVSIDYSSDPKNPIFYRMGG